MDSAENVNLKEKVNEENETIFLWNGKKKFLQQTVVV